MQVTLEIVCRLDPEDAALAARVRRLQNRRQPDRCQCPPPLGERADGRKRRLRYAVLGEGTAHHDLVAHSVGDGRADRGEAEALGHSRDDGDCPVGGDGERSVDVVATGHLGDRVDVGEVHRLGDICNLKPERVGVAIDGDDADALIPCLEDGAALVAPRANEEDGLHWATMLDDRFAAVTETTAAGAGTPRAASVRSRNRCRASSEPTTADRSRCR